MKLTVLQRCKSLLYSRFTGFKVFIFNFGLSHVSKNILKTGMLLHRQPKPRRFVGYMGEPMHFSKFVVKLLELTYLQVSCWKLRKPSLFFIINRWITQDRKTNLNNFKKCKNKIQQNISVATVKRKTAIFLQFFRLPYETYEQLSYSVLMDVFTNVLTQRNQDACGNIFIYRLDLSQANKKFIFK